MPLRVPSLRARVSAHTSARGFSLGSRTTQSPGSHKDANTPGRERGRPPRPQSPRSRPRAPGLMGHSVRKTARLPLPQRGLRAGRGKPHTHSACPAPQSRGCTHPQALSKASMLLDKRGRQAYLLVMELFLSFRASSRCCSSTMNLDRSSGVLGGQEHTGSAGCACRGQGSDPRGWPSARQAAGGPWSRTRACEASGQRVWAHSTAGRRPRDTGYVMPASPRL